MADARAPAPRALLRRSFTRRAAATTAVALLLGACSSASGSDRSADGPASGDSTTSTAPAPEVVFPGDEWERADPEDEGFDPEALDALATVAEEADSTCLVVTRRGRVVADWYWDDGAADAPQEVFSVTKSITSTLVGIAEADGDLDVGDSAADYVEEWAGTPSEDVTVEHLLSNDSGREWSLAIDYVQLIAERDRTQFAVDLSQQHAPGESWAYNNSAIQTLSRVLREATGEEARDLAAERLLGPLGMDHSEMTLDSSGHTSTFMGLRSTCEDLARFGYLFLRDGTWDGTEIVPPEWVEAATGAPSQDLNAGYGYLWWLNREGPLVGPTQAITPDAEQERVEGQMIPGGPEDLFTAQGLGGQVVLVDPGSEVVAVRLGPGVFDAPYSSRDLAPVVTEALVDP